MQFNSDIMLKWVILDQKVQKMALFLKVHMCSNGLGICNCIFGSKTLFREKVSAC